MKLHADAGKKPAHVKKDVPGFIGNRLQHALWREAISLVEHGICDAETVDTVIKAAFGRRLAVLGPLENADMVGTDLTLAIHKTVLPDIDSRPRPVALSGKAGRRGQARLQSGEGFRKWTPEQQAALRAKVLQHLKKARAEDCLTRVTPEGDDHDGQHRISTPHAGQDRHRRHRRARGATRDSGRTRSRRSSRSAMSARRPVRSPASARPIRSSSIRCAASCAKGLQSGGKTYRSRSSRKDSQSSGSRAAEVASELILGDKVDLIVASATPDTTNPVADQAEVNEVPCITTNCPWQPYFFGRKGDPTKGFTWTYHFFWGLEDVIGCVPGAVGRRADQQGRRRPVPQRRRRQRLGRSQARPAAGARPRPATSCTIPAATS